MSETNLTDTDTSTRGNSARGWPLRRVGLRVRNLETCLDYYRRLGLSLVRDERENGVVGLGSSSIELLQLRLLPGGRPRPARTAGLFHFALLLPDEETLGGFLQHCMEKNIPLDGMSDHAVSQAIYLQDPEGNGIEVYADRPREQWRWNGERVAMTTRALNTGRLLAKAVSFPRFPSKTRLGHMHLNVGNLDRTIAFYNLLGLKISADWPGQAKFLAWDGYHHHLGTNLWAGINAAPVEPDVSGIDFFELSRSDLQPGTLRDPDGIAVVVAPSATE